MKHLLRTLTLLPSLVAGSSLLQAQERPNVLFILADDLGWNDISCMGSNFYETPNIDGLTQHGTRFTNAYAACQVSSPSRASILTGQYTPRHGVTDWIGEAYGENWRRLNRHNKLLPAEYNFGLKADEYTLAQCLKDNGYTTFIAGKWHLGDKGSLPEDRGFEVNVGGWQAGSPVGGYFTPYNNPALPDGKKGENLSMRLAEETVKFMKKQKKEKKPFFAYLSFYAVHAPVQTTKIKWEHFREKAHKAGIAEQGFEFDRTQPVRTQQDNPIYAGLISQMDDAVGVVLEGLKKLGLDKNTIVIFTSDNGGVVSGDDYSSCLFPLRGGKGRQWEGGIRVPLIIDLPSSSKVEQVKTSDTPVNGIDFYPTLLNLLKIQKPQQQVLDGVDISPLLTGKDIMERPLFWHYPHYGNQGGEPAAMVRLGDWKLIHYYEDGRDELYNLKEDLGEHEPLNAQYPEKVKELRALLDNWLKDTDAKLPVPDMKYDPKEEAKIKQFMKTRKIQDLNNYRLKILDKDWKPNSDWWGSQTTID